MISRQVRDHIRSNVVGYVAVFLALTGTAGAATAINNNAHPNQIINRQIATAAVNSRTLARHAVHVGDLNRNSVRGINVRDGSLHGRDLGDNTVTGQQIDESTLDPSILQFRINGNCPAGQAIRSVAADGTTTCESTGTGTITGITTSGGLTGGGTSGSVNVGIDPTQTQSRVTESCSGNNAVQSVNQDGTVTCQPTGTGTVTSVGSGSGLSGGPITTSGSLSVDPTQVQTRVGGTCSGTQAVQGVDQNGTVDCSSSLVTTGHVLTPVGFQIANGATATLFSASGIQVLVQCVDVAGQTEPEATIGPTGGSVVNWAANSAASSNANYGLETGSTSGADKISVGTGVLGDRVDFDALLSLGGRTLSGNFQSFPTAVGTGASCVFSGTALASG